MTGHKAWNNKQIIKNCIICKKEFKVSPSFNRLKCCSRLCQHKNQIGKKMPNGFGKIVSERNKKILHTKEWISKIVETRRKNNSYKISEKQKNKIRNSIFLRYKTNPEIKDKIREKRYLQKRIYESKDEKKVHNFLINNGINFKKHKFISDIKHRYQCDIFIEPNIIIEIDGRYWHSKPENIIKDNIRTKELQEKGYKIYRYIIERNISDKQLDNILGVVNGKK